MDSLIVSKIDNQLVVDSRQVAEATEKRHADLLRDIETFSQYLENAKMRSQDFFIESDFKAVGNNKTYKCYLLTKKGCDMVANKMTGQKGVLFTAAYVTKFEEMKEELQAPMQELSPQLQLLINMELKQAEMETAITETNERLDKFKEVISLDTTSWRIDAKNLITQMALNLGGYEHIRDLRNQSYELLDKRMGVSVGVRLTNKRRRMAEEGVSKSKRDKLNPLDVIAEDKKLIEGYVAIIKEMAIKYGVTENVKEGAKA